MALLAIAALMIVGVRSALVLGLLVGVLNMIPYFGPFIGGALAACIWKIIDCNCDKKAE